MKYCNEFVNMIFHGAKKKKIKIKKKNEVKNKNKQRNKMCVK